MADIFFWCIFILWVGNFSCSIVPTLIGYAIEFWTRGEAEFDFKPSVELQHKKWQWLADSMDARSNRIENKDDAFITALLFDGFILGFITLVALGLVDSGNGEVLVTVFTILAFILGPRFIFDKIREENNKQEEES